MKLGIAAATVALALTGTACSGDSDSRTERPAPTSTPSSSGTPGAPGAELTVTRAGVVTTTRGSIGPLGLGEDAVAFPFAAGTGDWDTVEVATLPSGRARAVAHSEFGTGLINWAATTEGWVVYVDQSARQGDSTPDVLWRVHAVDLETGADRVLATNGRAANPYVPIVHGSEGVFFWTQAETDRSAREFAWRPGDARPTTVLRHAEMTPGSETLSGGTLVYLGPAAYNTDHHHTVGGDCWGMPVTGGTPEPLTATALAMGCAVHGGQLVWTQHIDPETTEPPDDGVLDDPYELWTEDVEAREPHLLHRGYLPADYPSAGDGFALWRTFSGAATVQGLADRGIHRIPRSSEASLPPVTSGTYVAHTSGVPGGRMSVRVYRVASSG